MPDRSRLVPPAARADPGEALEGEVRDEIGRERHERADGEAKGYRNGYRLGQMKTAEGMVEFSAPQVRDTPEPFASAIRESLAGRTQALEDLAVERYARGLSTRDIEHAFRDEIGRRLLSRVAVSEITERLWMEYEAFTRRDLSEYRIVYLDIDGIAERLRVGLIRQVLQHLSNRKTAAILAKFKWAIITEHYPHHSCFKGFNTDIAQGAETRLLHGSAVYLDRAPFNVRIIASLAEVDVDRDNPLEGQLRTWLVDTKASNIDANQSPSCN